MRSISLLCSRSIWQLLPEPYREEIHWYIQYSLALLLLLLPADTATDCLYFYCDCLLLLPAATSCWYCCYVVEHLPCSCISLILRKSKWLIYVVGCPLKNIFFLYRCSDSITYLQCFELYSKEVATLQW